MTNCEHLIENALASITRAGQCDGYEAFKKEMNYNYNKEMLKQVSITQDELWEIAQYILYSYIPNM
jgi:hypothetical protein